MPKLIWTLQDIDDVIEEMHKEVYAKRGKLENKTSQWAWTDGYCEGLKFVLQLIRKIGMVI